MGAVPVVVTRTPYRQESDMTTIGSALRRALGRPPRPSDSWSTSDGNRLTYLGPAPDKWNARVCDVCGGPATEYKTLPPWPGTSHSHTSMTCDEHSSYLDGMTWMQDQEGVWHEDRASRSSCATCHEPYGSCGHTAQYKAMMDAQEAAAIRGKVASR